MDCTTYHFDRARTGHNSQFYYNGAEWKQYVHLAYELTDQTNPDTGQPINQCPGSSGVRAAPLVCENWTLPSGERHNLIFVARVDNVVRAYAEAHIREGYTNHIWERALTTPWESKLATPNMRRNSNLSTKPGSNTYIPVGICGSPTLDLANRRLFVVALHADPQHSKAGGIFCVYALSMDTGVIEAQATLVDPGAPGRPTFNSAVLDQRGGLSLIGGWITTPKPKWYLLATFADYWVDDDQEYYGWLVTCDVDNLQDQKYFCTVKNNKTASGKLILNGAGIWGPGGATVEQSPTTRVFVVTGNGTQLGDDNLTDYWAQFGKTIAPGTRGDFFQAVVQLNVDVSGNMTAGSWYQPTNAETLNISDWDLGGASAVLVDVNVGSRDRKLLLTGDKQGNIYLLDRDSLINPNSLGKWGHELALLRNQFKGGDGIKAAPAVFRSASGELYVYFVGDGQPGLAAFKIVASATGDPTLQPAWKANLNLQAGPGSPVVASMVNGGPGSNASATVWMIGTPNGADLYQPVLYGFDAITGTQVYMSPSTGTDSVPATTDHNLWHPWTFAPVTVAARSVLVGTYNGVACYRQVGGKQPALATFGPELFLSWKGGYGDDRLLCSAFSTAWNSQPAIPGGSSHGASFMEFNGRLYAAWKGAWDDQRVWWSSFDGRAWTQQQLINGVGTTSGFSLAVFKEGLYATWKGARNDQRIFWSVFNGTSWSAQQPVPDVGTSNGPSLAVYKAQLYMAWKSMEHDRTLYWSRFDGTKWVPQQTIPNVGSAQGPSLAADNTRLYAAWRGIPGDQRLWWSSFDGQTWTQQKEIGNYASSIGPGLATFDSKLFAVWKGMFDDEKLYWAAYDGTNWTAQAILNGGSTSSDV